MYEDLLMKTNLFFINKFIAIVFLVTHACTWNMLSLPDGIFHCILAHSVEITKSLEKIIGPTLLSSTVCKKFNTEQSLITMGKACTCYTLEEKNAAMKMLLKKMNDVNYHNKRHAALLLTYAGAENNAYAPYPLLQDAVYQADMQMIMALFENGANPDQKNKYPGEPIFFNAKKIDIVQKFITQGVNLNAQGYFNSNVLFACLTYDRSLEMIKFYLDNKVSATQKGLFDNNLLHRLATKNIIYYNIEDYLEIGTLLSNRGK